MYGVNLQNLELSVGLVLQKVGIWCLQLGQFVFVWLLFELLFGVGGGGLVWVFVYGQYVQWWLGLGVVCVFVGLVGGEVCVYVGVDVGVIVVIVVFEQVQELWVEGWGYVWIMLCCIVVDILVFECRREVLCWCLLKVQVFMIVQVGGLEFY